jgi:hypothetical protein
VLMCVCGFAFVCAWFCRLESLPLTGRFPPGAPKTRCTTRWEAPSWTRSCRATMAPCWRMDRRCGAAQRVQQCMTMSVALRRSVARPGPLRLWVWSCGARGHAAVRQCGGVPCVALSLRLDAPHPPLDPAVPSPEAPWCYPVALSCLFLPRHALCFAVLRCNELCFAVCRLALQGTGKTYTMVGGLVWPLPRLPGTAVGCRVVGARCGWRRLQ